MTLTECNHVITEITVMLNGLEDIGVIDGVDKHNLLPVIFKEVVKNEAIAIPI